MGGPSTPLSSQGFLLFSGTAGWFPAVAARSPERVAERNAVVVVVVVVVGGLGGNETIEFVGFRTGDPVCVAIGLPQCCIVNARDTSFIPPSPGRVGSLPYASWAPLAEGALGVKVSCPPHSGAGRCTGRKNVSNSTFL